MFTFTRALYVLQRLYSIEYDENTIMFCEFQVLIQESVVFQKTALA